MKSIQEKVAVSAHHDTITGTSSNNVIRVETEEIRNIIKTNSESLAIIVAKRVSEMGIKVQSMPSQLIPALSGKSVIPLDKSETS